MCSLGDEIAETLSRRLGWEIITRDRVLSDIFARTADRQELYMLSESPRFYLSKTRDGIRFIDFLRKEVNDIADSRSAILVGFGSQFLVSERRDAIRLRITAPQDVRIGRLKNQYNLSEADAATILKTSDRKQSRFFTTVYGIEPIAGCSPYDLVLNTGLLTVDECASSIIALVSERENRLRRQEQTENTQIRDNQTSLAAFKNPEETEFAQILDSYHIEWIYEPKTFPIEWDAEGNVKLAFSPDFYLPKFDLYLELTIMNQKYVTRKNRKVKKLRELYPGTNIRIVYKKDFQTLIERFNELGG
jgi:cytidylate kinase